MGLREANDVQVRAQAAIGALTPVRQGFVPVPATNSPVAGDFTVMLGHAVLQRFTDMQAADAYVARLEAVLKPCREEIETMAIADVRAALDV